MTADTRPKNHAIVAHVADDRTAEAALAAIAKDAGVDLDTVRHGSGEDFAAELEAGDEDSGVLSRLVKGIVSYGMDREELVRLGEHVREGRHAIIINDVTDRECMDLIVAVLKRHDAQDIVYFGDWQTEDLSINR